MPPPATPPRAAMTPPLPGRPSTTPPSRRQAARIAGAHPPPHLDLAAKPQTCLTHRSCTACNNQCIHKLCITAEKSVVARRSICHWHRNVALATLPTHTKAPTEHPAWAARPTKMCLAARCEFRAFGHTRWHATCHASRSWRALGAATMTPTTDRDRGTSLAPALECHQTSPMQDSHV